MHERDSGKNLEEQARRLYRESAAGLDTETRARLARSRGTALQAGPRLVDSRWWIPAVATAGAAAVALAVVLNTGGGDEPLEIAAVTDDVEAVELLLATESLDMLSDLDFYLWLDAEPDAG